MSEILDLKKPYEISVWGDRLVTGENNIKYFEETKLAVIGSNTMTALNKVFSPILKINTNGEKTLTFSLNYYYFDDLVGDFVVNPFRNLLINERKIKLFYDDEWYDFVIKEKSEDSENHVYEYTATDAFVQELARNGYNVTFDQELNNNQGTIIELAKKTLEDTDWIVDEENSDLLRQTVSEPIYVCQVNGSFQVLDLDRNRETMVYQGETIYIFYSYIANKTTLNVQLMRMNDIETTPNCYDDNNALHLTNYRFMGVVKYNDDGTIEFGNSSAKATVGDINLESQGYRLVYNTKATYDPIMGRTVEILEAEYDNEKQEIYSYKDYEYSTSAAVVSYIVNGSNFNFYDAETKVNGTRAVGWNNQCVNDSDDFYPIDLTTIPRIGLEKGIVKLDQFSKIVSYLRMQFPAANQNNKFANAFYNEGITQNVETIDHIAKGEEYVFRVRYGWSNSPDTENLNFPLLSNNTVTLRAVVAKYKYVDKVLSDKTIVQVKEIDKNNIYFDFSNNFIQKNSTIYGGKLENNDTLYVIDGVVQTPSLKYAYDVAGTKYVWNPDSQKFVLGSLPSVQGGYSFMPYYYTVASAMQPLSHATLANPSENIGLFLYDTRNQAHYVFIEDVAFFKKVVDGDGNIVFPDAAPLAVSSEQEYFYLKPEKGALPDEIEQFHSLSSLASELNISEEKIKRKYNDKCEKNLSIQVSKTNYFDILQTLCETFECWLKFDIKHDSNGKIVLDENYKPIKKVVFKEFIGKPNYAGFKYGINLNSIQRSIDSSEFVTKLIVDEPTNEYVPEGIMSISNASSNPMGESFILNFNYYLKNGLIDKTNFNSDLMNLYDTLFKANDELKRLNREYRLAKNDLDKITAQRDVFSTTIDEANEEMIQAIEEFEKSTNVSYESYAEDNPDENKNADNDEILETLYKIYSNAAVVNNYSGIVTNIKQQYNALNLKCNGTETYAATVITSNGTQETSPSTKLIFNNYFEGFKCDFIKDGAVLESYETTIISKTFNSDTVYDTIIIKQLPKNYGLQIFTGAKIITLSNNQSYSIKIYDGDNHIGLTKRFKLVPLEQSAGFKETIEQKEKAKKQIINDFNSKYSKFIQEGTWSSNDYTNAELYYFDAVQVSNTSAQPKVSYTINVAEISEIEGFENYKFYVGDKTYIEDVRFLGARVETINGVTLKTPVKEEVIVSEVEWHLDEPESNVITVQNYKTQFEDLFQRISATVQSVQYNSASYARAASIFDENGNINTDLLVSSLNGLGNASYTLGGSGAIRVTDEGLLINDLKTFGKSLLIKSGGISRTVDGGITWEQILSPDGISINALKAGTIDTSQISIMDNDNPAFRWDKYGLSAFGYSEDGSYDLTTFVRFDKYGLYGVKQGGDYVVKSIDDLQDKAHFGITWDGFFIKNNYTDGYVSISSDNDFQVMKKNINEHDEYRSTTDTEIDPEKTYYTQQITEVYEVVELPIAEDLQYYYEYDDINDIYFLTEDTELVLGKTYYRRNDFISYVAVVTPQIEELSTYYEILEVETVDYSEKIKIGAIEFDNNNNPIKYGINIRNDNGDVVFTTDDKGDLVMTGTIHASAGEIGGMKVNHNELTMDTIVLKPNTGIYSTNQIQTGERPIYEEVWIDDGMGGGSWETVDTGDTIPTYEPVFLISDSDGSAIFNNARIRGEINAGSGNFYGMVTVGKDDEDENKPYIQIDGVNSLIKTSNYQDGAGYGWMINKDGDAIFNNITARGAIKTAVFEYAEIQAVGGVFLFRPSSTIKSARVSGSNLIVTVEKPYLFAKINYNEVTNPTGNPKAQGWYERTNYGYKVTDDTTVDISKTYYIRVVTPHSWCKVSNYTNDGSEPDIQATLENNGLVHVYEVTNVDLATKEITLSGAAAMVDSQTGITTLEELEGGALIDMGRKSGVEGYDNGIHNYGIGVNSSDNTVNLPARSISLFETIINDTQSVKVTYDYKGVFGTLPTLPVNKVNGCYTNYMAGTQGIYTDNIYFGDKDQYIAFYKDNNNNKHLKISASEIIYEVDGQGNETTWEEHLDEEIDAATPISVEVSSNVGNLILKTNTIVTLTCTVKKGNTDITSQVSTFTWTKLDRNGVVDPDWVSPSTGNQITITASEIKAKAIFICEVTI